MAKLNVCNVQICNNPAPFTSELQFEVTFDCYEPLEDDVEWRLIWVGKADDEEKDQLLETMCVGPIPVGKHKFLIETPPPKQELIPEDDLIGVTVIILEGSYNDKLFLKIGYYVNIAYTDEALIDDPPAKPIIEKLERNILATEPRVTKFPISWDNSVVVPSKDQQGVTTTGFLTENTSSNQFTSGDEENSSCQKDVSIEQSNSSIVTETD